MVRIIGFAFQFILRNDVHDRNPYDLDPYVMREWGKQHKSGKVLMLADGDMSFHQSLGLLQNLPFCGQRGRRFSMYIEDGEIKILKTLRL